MYQFTHFYPLFRSYYRLIFQLWELMDRLILVYHSVDRTVITSYLLPELRLYSFIHLSLGMFRNLVERASWTNYRARILWQSTHHLEVSHPNQGCWINWSHLKNSRNVYVTWWGNCRLSWSWWDTPILGMLQSRQIQVKERDEILWKRYTHNFYEDDSMSTSNFFPIAIHHSISWRRSQLLNFFIRSILDQIKGH